VRGGGRPGQLHARLTAAQRNARSRPGPAQATRGRAALSAWWISTSNAGLGLWALHQLDIDTALIRAGDGFTVRLRAGTIPD